MINSRWVKYLNVKLKPYEYQKNTWMCVYNLGWENLPLLWLRIWFLVPTNNINNPKSLLGGINTTSYIKRQMRKSICNLNNKVFISLIYKELLKIEQIWIHIFQWTRHMSLAFTEKEKQITLKQVKRYLTLINVREIQTKTVLIYYFWLVKYLKSQVFDNLLYR